MPLVFKVGALAIGPHLREMESRAGDLQKRVDVTKVVIEGYSNEPAADDSERKLLSRVRAQGVWLALRAQGVTVDRLDFVGCGRGNLAHAAWVLPVISEQEHEIKEAKRCRHERGRARRKGRRGSQLTPRPVARSFARFHQP